MRPVGWLIAANSGLIDRCLQALPGCHMQRTNWAEATQLCNDAYAYFGHAISRATSCKWKGLAYAISSSAPTDHPDRERTRQLRHGHEGRLGRGLGFQDRRSAGELHLGQQHMPDLDLPTPFTQ
jgi:hypothetical protein